MDKKDTKLLRKEASEKRKALKDREEKDRRIFENFLKVLPAETKRVLIYASYNGEADTEKIIDALLEKRLQVFCPKVCGKELKFYRILSREELKEGFRGIREPEEDPDRLLMFPEEGETPGEACEEAFGKSEMPGKAPEETPESSSAGKDKKNLLVVPGLIFDTCGGRIGYGGGYYDRFLSRHPVFSCALAYEAQVMPERLDLMPWDRPMDRLITEERVWDFQ